MGLACNYDMFHTLVVDAASKLRHMIFRFKWDGMAFSFLVTDGKDVAKEPLKYLPCRKCTESLKH